MVRVSLEPADGVAIDVTDGVVSSSASLSGAARRRKRPSSRALRRFTRNCVYASANVLNLRRRGPTARTGGCVRGATCVDTACATGVGFEGRHDAKSHAQTRRSVAESPPAAVASSTAESVPTEKRPWNDDDTDTREFLRAWRRTAVVVAMGGSTTSRIRAPLSMTSEVLPGRSEEARYSTGARSV